MRFTLLANARLPVFMDGANWKFTGPTGPPGCPNPAYTLSRVPKLDGVAPGRQTPVFPEKAMVSCFLLSSGNQAPFKKWKGQKPLKQCMQQQLSGSRKCKHDYGTFQMNNCVYMYPGALQGVAKCVLELHEDSIKLRVADFNGSIQVIGNGGAVKLVRELWVTDAEMNAMMMEVDYPEEEEVGGSGSPLKSRTSSQAFDQLFERGLFRKDDFTDVEIRFGTKPEQLVVEGDGAATTSQDDGQKDDQVVVVKVFHCHAVVLSRQSSVWKRELASDMEEGRGKVIDASDPLFTVDAFENFLRALYNLQTLETMGVEALCSVYRLADKYDAQAVFTVLRTSILAPDGARRLVAKITCDPVSICAAIDLAYTFELEHLFKLCFNGFAAMAYKTDPKHRLPQHEQEGNSSAGSSDPDAGMDNMETNNDAKVHLCESAPWKALVTKYPQLPFTLRALGKLK